MDEKERPKQREIERVRGERRTEQTSKRREKHKAKNAVTVREREEQQNENITSQYVWDQQQRSGGPLRWAVVLNILAYD